MARIIARLEELIGTEGFLEFERQTVEAHRREAEERIIATLQAVLRDPEFLCLLKLYAQQCACRFIGWRKLYIRLSSGERYAIISPVFLRAKPKDKRRRRKRREVLQHLGLKFLGIHDQCSPLLVSHCVQLTTLCPSFDTATEVLQNLGIRMNHSLLQRLCYRIADRVMANRQDNVVDGFWQTAGLRLLVCIDAGRLRERRNRRGRKKKGAKRHGYSSEWVAPWLITIHCVDETGKVRREVRPIYDGTVGDINTAFDLLKGYLERINLTQAEVVTFCADGGNGIWERIDQLEEEFPEAPIHRVLDYTHAKQNLKEIADLIHQACGVWDYEYAKVLKQLNNWLWQGKIDSIRTFINDRLHRKRQKKKALKKLNDYFGNAEKFQYQTYREAGLPIGSGTVESAIRRVINLRVKSAGQFWKLENAERMIFLRSQVLSGRWHSALGSALSRPSNTLDSSILESDLLVA